jgi:hypothetical protein
MSGTAEHPGPDPGLLAACDGFHFAHREMKAGRGDTPEAEAASDRAMDAWYASIATVKANSAHTPAGQQAKARVPYTALHDVLPIEEEDGHREEFAALAFLAELIGEAANSAAKSDAIASAPVRALSVLEIGRQLREAGDRFDASDARMIAAPEGSPECQAATTEHDAGNLEELMGWRRLAFCRVPATLPDAAAQLAILYDHVADLDTSTIEQLPNVRDLLNDIKTTTRVIAGLAVTVARIAGLDISSVVDNELPRRLAKHVPMAEA